MHTTETDNKHSLIANFCGIADTFCGQFMASMHLTFDQDITQEAVTEGLKNYDCGMDHYDVAAMLVSHVRGAAKSLARMHDCSEQYVGTKVAQMIIRKIKATDDAMFVRCVGECFRELLETPPLVNSIVKNSSAAAPING